MQLVLSVDASNSRTIMRLGLPIDYPKYTFPSADDCLFFEKIIASNNFALLKKITQIRANLVHLVSNAAANYTDIIKNAEEYLAHLKGLLDAVEHPNLMKKASQFFGFKDVPIPPPSWKSALTNEQFPVKFTALDSLIAFELAITVYIIGASYANLGAQAIAPVSSETDSIETQQNALTTACNEFAKASGVFSWGFANIPTMIIATLTRKDGKVFQFPEVFPVIHREHATYSMLLCQICATELARLRKTNSSLMSKLYMKSSEMATLLNSTVGWMKPKNMSLAEPIVNHGMLGAYLTLCAYTTLAASYLERVREYTAERKYGEAAYYGRKAMSTLAKAKKVEGDTKCDYLLTLTIRVFREVEEEASVAVSDNERVYFCREPVSDIPLAGVNIKHETPYQAPQRAFGPDDLQLLAQ